MIEVREKLAITSKILIASGILGAGLFGLYLFRSYQAITPTLPKPLPVAN